MRAAIRPARPDDVPDLLRFVRDLATYEREPDSVAATEDDFTAALFPTVGGPVASAHVAEVAGAPAGMALWFPTFSTWTGRQGMWLEDLYVDPAHRGAGLGRALLAELAAECVRRGWPRLEWTVLDWNEPALGFYRGLGAEPLADWTTHRVTGAALRTLAQGRPDGVSAAASRRAGC
ncbi:MAG: GNAT family N-acetyltransferase [Austwickia sp.]|nr:MAG: GNAT family N-acetyltransferase [Austwickia sp.]